MAKRKQSQGAAMVAAATVTFTPEPDPAIVAIADAPQEAFDKALDDLKIPERLKRTRTAPVLPATEDMNTAPKLVVDNTSRPLELPGDGMNIIELSLHSGTDHETGLRRYLCVSMGTKSAQLLHVPDLEHIEVDIRYINDRVANGKAKWFSLPANLGQRLIDKSVQWEMHGIRYSRSLMNEALTKLGMPALPDRPELTAAPGTVAHERAARRASAKAERGPGVIDVIIRILREGGGTIDEMLAKLMEAFPDRDATMRNTIKTQLNRLPKQGRLEIVRDGNRYRAKDAAPAPVEGQGTADKANFVAKGALPATNSFAQEVAKQKAREEEYLERPTFDKTQPAKPAKRAKAKKAK